MTEKQLTRLTQAEVEYHPLSNVDGKACANCRWFDAVDGGYCHIVENTPLDVLATGICSHHEPFPEFAPVDDEPTLEELLSTSEEETPVIDSWVDYSDQAKGHTTAPAETPVPQKELSPLLAGIKSVLNDVMRRRVRVERTGFKVYGDKWVAWYTNNFKDREGEFFTEKAIDAYIHRVELGMVEYPELWLWHTKGTRIGEAKRMARIGHFVVAVGEFDDTDIGSTAKAYFAKSRKAWALSHGFTYRPDAKIGNVYHQFNTFEISVLPPKVAANPFTIYQIKEFTMTEEQKAAFAEILGKEKADQLFADTERMNKAVEEMGVEFKDFTDVAAVSEGADAPAEAVKSIAQSIGDMLLDVVKDSAATVDMTNAIGRALKAHQTAADERNTALEARIKAQDEAIAALKAQLDDRPRQATQAAETVVTPEQVKAMGIETVEMVTHPIFGTQVPANSLPSTNSNTLK